jgi:formiminoglutamate deiminase
MTRSASSFHCELAWLGGDLPDADVRIDVAGGVIERIETGAQPAQDAVPLAGLTLPGLANAHSHAFHRALRGRTQRGPGTFWTWRDDMYRLAAALDPESYHRLARATFAEMVLAGVTCVGEFHYVHHQPDGTPYPDPNEMGAVMLAAAAEAGVRITLLDTCYLGSGVEPDGGLRPPLDGQLRFSDHSAARWIERVERLFGRTGPTSRVGGAVHSVRAVDPQSMGMIAAWAATRRVPLHAHVSEQPAENEQCLAAYGVSPLGLLGRRGALSERFTAVHSTHVDAADVELLSRTGSMVCMCPTTERDLADGIGPTADFAQAGVAICLGSDSHAVIDLFEEARAVELDERLRSGVRGTHDAASLLAAASAVGYRSLGWPDGGRIATGALADLTTVSLQSVRTAGTTPGTALAGVVFAASAGDVTDVVVAGEHLVRDGRHRSIDVTAELDAAIRATWAAAA